MPPPNAARSGAPVDHAPAKPALITRNNSNTPTINSAPCDPDTDPAPPLTSAHLFAAAPPRTAPPSTLLAASSAVARLVAAVTAAPVATVRPVVRAVHAPADLPVDALCAPVNDAVAPPGAVLAGDPDFVGENDGAGKAAVDAAVEELRAVLGVCATLPADLREVVWPWLLAVLRAVDARHDLRADSDSHEDQVDDPGQAECEEDVAALASASIANLSGRAAASGAGAQHWHFPGTPIHLTIAEASLAQAELGCVTWGSGAVLAALLANQTIPIRPNARVLELGSGTGVAGLVAARFAENMTLTDGHVGVVKVLAENAASNAPHARVAQFDWNWALNGDDRAAEFRGCADVVLAADVIYEPAAVAPFAAAVKAACANEGAEVVVVLPMRVRYAHEVHLFEEAMRWMIVDERVVALDGGYYKVYANHALKW
ncbi:Methyltransferase-like protein 21A [Allomyces arbusculus]|nr:Methyltransferase-like protein 21A [Allomyces arbusculus]